MTRRLTCAQAIIEFLKQQYTSRDGSERRLIAGVFGIFGHGNVAGLGQALEEFGGNLLPYLQPKNEQAMVHAATAFAKECDRLSTYACTTSVGPGATNMVTGAATATTNRLPVLLLPGDVFANRRAAPVLQQLEHPLSQDISVNDCLRPVCRYWDRIQRPEQILAALPEAMRVLTDPAETGAVALCLPQDVQVEAFDYPVEFFSRRTYFVRRLQPDPGAVQAAVQRIRLARRPLIIAGGGVHYAQARDALERLVTSTGIPVAVTQAGKGSLLDEHPLCLGSIGATGTLAANRIASEADLVVCIGTRLSDFTTGSRTQFQNDQVRFVSLNVTSLDAFKLGALAVVGCAKASLQALIAALGDYRVSDACATDVAQARAEWELAHAAVVAAQDTRTLRPADVIRILNRHVDENSVVVHAAGGLPGDCHKLWKSRAPRDYHSEYAYSCMGYEIAGALGVKLAHPRKEVYALVGDGSFLMLNHEIVTSIQEDLKITVVLLDNHGYQCIHGLQRSCGSAGFGNEFRRRNPATDQLDGPIVPIDFVQNAESLGAVAMRVDDEGSLEQALRHARRERTTCLIHVPVQPHSTTPGYSWWDVPVAETSSDERTRAARQAYEVGLARRRFYNR